MNDYCLLTIQSLIHIHTHTHSLKHSHIIYFFTHSLLHALHIHRIWSTRRTHDSNPSTPTLHTHTTRAVALSAEAVVHLSTPQSSPPAKNSYYPNMSHQPQEPLGLGKSTLLLLPCLITIPTFQTPILTQLPTQKQQKMGKLVLSTRIMTITCLRWRLIWASGCCLRLIPPQVSESVSE